MARHDKQIALQLRAQGKTYGEIREILDGVSKSTLSLWFRDMTSINNSQLLKGRELSRYVAAQRRRESREKHTIEIIRDAQREFSSLVQTPLFLAGLCLYWAEGDKNKQERVKFTNSDERMVLFMMRWFREICEVPEEKFRIALHIHNLHSSGSVKQYWSVITEIPEKQFQKIYIKETSLHHRKNVLYNGTCAIVVNNKDLFRRISGWKLSLVEYFQYFSPRGDSIHPEGTNV